MDFRETKEHPLLFNSIKYLKEANNDVTEINRVVEEQGEKIERFGRKALEIDLILREASLMLLNITKGATGRRICTSVLIIFTILIVLVLKVKGMI